MRISSIVFFILLALLVGISGCDIKKPPPNNGPVVYPPTWPLPTVTAMPNATKAKPFFHVGWEVKGKESPWYMDNAVDIDNDNRLKWLISYYYHGTPSTVFAHVEKGLNASGFRWSQTSTWKPANDRNGSSQKVYEFRDNNGKVYRLFVDYTGWAKIPDVEYCIVKDPGI